MSVSLAAPLFIQRRLNRRGFDMEDEQTPCGETNNDVAGWGVSISLGRPPCPDHLMLMLGHT
jgi:hypothetical protein